MALALLSGNRCAFPGCPEKIYTQRTIIGEIAHIHGRKLGAARWVAGIPASELRAIANLIYLCANHHTLVDKHPDAEKTYPAETVRTWKANHEAEADSNPMGEIVELLRQLVPSLPVYWEDWPDAPVFEMHTAFSQPKDGSPWKLELGIAQKAGGAIGKLTYAYQRGEEVPTFTPAKLRNEREWRCEPITFTPDGRSLAVILKFWWQNADRTVTFRWDNEGQITKVDQGKIVTYS
jgi:hypothetical protein